MSGKLFVVATPIGNLGDLSRRAVETLREVDAILCEDTRVTRKLLSAYEIAKPTISHHAHTSEQQMEHIVGRLAAGACMALVSDAGTPLLSDPGGRLVNRALQRGLEVVPIPGASAALAALVASGLPTQPFCFLGFLPRGKAAQRELVAPVAKLRMTLVIYESPGRLTESLRHLAIICGDDRPACVAREITKKFETYERGTLSDLASRFELGTKGELVVVIGPSDGVDTVAVSLVEEARRLLNGGGRPSEVAKTLAGAFGVSKKVAYAAVLEVSGASSGGSTDIRTGDRTGADPD